MCRGQTKPVQVHQAVINTKKDISKISIACLGLSFKPDIDDLRESPSLEITKKIAAMGFKKQYIVEPNIIDLPVELKTSLSELVDLQKAIVSSDILLLLVDHTPFKKMNLELLSGKQIVDTRGAWSEK